MLLSLDLWYAHEQIKKLGGRPELSAVDRSLYPYGFSCGEEAGIVRRLRTQQPVGSAAEDFGQRARS